MEGATLSRWRWRLRGAWMWPCFIVFTLLDGAIAHGLPPLGDHLSAVAGWLLGVVCTLIAIILLAPPLGWLVRRIRGDMPRVVARDYAGAWVCVAVTAALLAAGIAHRPVVRSDRQALQDATARAEAYIGDHAPAAIIQSLQERHASLVSFPVEPPEIYRVCARARGSAARVRWYCVVVNRAKPFGRSVKYDGSEPNSVLSEGTS